MSSVRAEVWRGGAVESVHMGSIDGVNVEGRLIASAGDPDRLLYFFRSPAKPFQAIPVIESGAADRYGFTQAKLALCCASHSGTPLHQAILDLVAEVCDVPRDSMLLATDGCTLPTFGSSLRSFARAYAALAQPRRHADALDRLRDAMIAVPENVAGPGEFNTDLMRVAGGAPVAKTGAEALLSIGVPNRGLGIAIRIGDGAYRAHPAVTSECLRQLGVLDESALTELRKLHEPTIYNHNRRVAGEIRPAFRLDS